MVRIDWEQYKEYKAMRDDPHGYDNFKLLLEFIRSFYNMHGIFDIYEMLANDELAQMMLDKRGINDPEALEHFIFHEMK